MNLRMLVGREARLAGSLLFVHGTGVRLKNYRESRERIDSQMRRNGVGLKLASCAWGDPLGVMFEGLSLPDPPDEATLALEADEETRWTWLFEDPLFELNALAIRGQGAMMAIGSPGSKPKWLTEWERISAYHPSQEFELLLERSGLREDWDAAWAEIVRGSAVPEAAFEASAAENELADAVKALGRALVASAHIRAIDEGRPGPTLKMRDALLDRLVNEDWGYAVFGLGTFVTGLFKRAATRALRRRRNKFSALSALPLGDILLYQGRGGEVRDFIRRKITEAEPPVSILAHSLGGIASVDLLAGTDPPRVAHLITIGSQAPYFYEIDALQSLKRPQGLPPGFPPWLNIYDRNDFLSFVGGPLFGTRVTDQEVESGQPFPDSHSAYISSDEVWTAISDFVAR